jgi:hypothetical protein
VAPIFEGFALSSLGSPEAAAQQFLDTIAAPAGSDKTAALVAAEQRCVRACVCVCVWVGGGEAS